MNPKRYVGGDVTVTYDLRRCIHASECARGLPAVFDPARRPWVDPDAADPEAIAEVIERCPSGALHYTFTEGDQAEPIPATNTVRVDANGPLYLRGNVHLVTPEGETLLHDTRVALCRCGGSGNKPFCDGSHSAIGFQDDGAVATVEVPTDLTSVEPGVALTVTPRRNASYLFSGLFEIQSSDGTVVRTEAKKSLCRCGASKNKPFCDASHKEIGFEAP